MPPAAVESPAEAAGAIDPAVEATGDEPALVHAAATASAAAATRATRIGAVRMDVLSSWLAAGPGRRMDPQLPEAETVRSPWTNWSLDDPKGKVSTQLPCWSMR